ncbi:MAG TPA: hypothetical protein DHW82_09680 [Spirochaetia bacterium]|nr:MAG: hypothetical protein A2Y41_00480 [Spirochaetes bacterium GWB1_36_13]HCL57261.1 hypothetical protein [Spirochaetia bacterium]
MDKKRGRPKTTDKKDTAIRAACTTARKNEILKIAVKNETTVSELVMEALEVWERAKHNADIYCNGNIETYFTLSEKFFKKTFEGE